MKEVVCVMPPFVTMVSCSFDMAYDLNYLELSTSKEFTAQLKGM